MEGGKRVDATGAEKRTADGALPPSKVPRKRGRRSKREIEEAAAAIAAVSAGASGQASTEGGHATDADAAAARRAHQKTLSLNRLYGDPNDPDSREFMHVNMGHALMRRDDVFYLHPLSERCLIQRGSVPCPDPSRATVYRNTLDIRASGPCMHCDRECAAGRVPLPRAYDARTRAYAVWGNFCSFPCAMGYQLEHGAGVYDTPYVLMLLQKMAAEVWGREGLVCPAPPRFCLRKFGGAVDPEDIEALSEKQHQAIVEAPFVSWAMMVECKSVDTTSRAIKRIIAPASAPPLPSSSTSSSPLAPADPSRADPTETEPSQQRHSTARPLDMAKLADAEDDESEAESLARISRAWNLRGLPPHDPNMEHPGALCRAGGVMGIDASAGRRDAQRRAESGISLLGTTRALPVGTTIDGTSTDAVGGSDDVDTYNVSLWEQFLRARAGATPQPPAAESGQT